MLADQHEQLADALLLDDLRARAISAITWSIASCICSITFGPKADIASRPASRTAAPLTSIERATWPFLRASSFFLGVAFSVLSLRHYATCSDAEGHA